MCLLCFQGGEVAAARPQSRNEGFAEAQKDRPLQSRARSHPQLGGACGRSALVQSIAGNTRHTQSKTGVLPTLQRFFTSFVSGSTQMHPV